MVNESYSLDHPILKIIYACFSDQIKGYTIHESRKEKYRIVLSGFLVKNLGFLGWFPIL